MSRLRKAVGVAAVMAGLLCAGQSRAGDFGGLVDTDHQKYTHKEMLADLDSIVARYPGCVGVMEGDTTALGRDIPIVFLGNVTAPHHVMVQASMHAREYMASLLVMAMIETYAEKSVAGETYKGVAVSQLLDSVCFVILPMVNPDGIEIAQWGTVGDIDAATRQWVDSMAGRGVYHYTIKANSRGVDLNRNFSNGFAAPGVRHARHSKHFYHYMGPAPYSEAETQFMVKVSRLFDYSLFLNYHACGNIIFYGCMNAPRPVNAEAERFARLASRHTGYRLFGPDSAIPNGSWADEVEVRYGRPSVTIEIGTRSPVPISEFSTIYNKNLWVWADIALTLIAC